MLSPTEFEHELRKRWPGREQDRDDIDFLVREYQHAVTVRVTYDILTGKTPKWERRALHPDAHSALEEFVAFSTDTRRDPMSSDEDDYVTVCLVCDDVEGHRPGCIVELAERTLREDKRG